MDEHNHHIHMHLTCVLTMCLLLMLTTLPHYSHCESPQIPFDYSVCKERPYNCGTLLNISYPFWGQNRPPQCGGGDPFKLNCHNGNTTILIDSQNFTVKEVNHNLQTTRLVRTDLALNVCSPQFGNTSLNHTLLWYRSSIYNLTIFYDCPIIPDYINHFYSLNFTCGQAICYYVADIYYEGSNLESQFQSCKRRLHVPTHETNYYDLAVTEDLNEGFMINYNVSEVCTECLGIEGDCWNSNGGVDNCYYCPDGSHGLHCSSPTGSRMSSILSPLYVY